MPLDQLATAQSFPQNATYITMQSPLFLLIGLRLRFSRCLFLGFLHSKKQKYFSAHSAALPSRSLTEARFFSLFCTERRKESTRAVLQGVRPSCITFLFLSLLFSACFFSSSSCLISSAAFFSASYLPACEQNSWQHTCAHTRHTHTHTHARTHTHAHTHITSLVNLSRVLKL